MLLVAEASGVSVGDICIHTTNTLWVTFTVRPRHPLAAMKPPSTALLRAFSPLWQSSPMPWTARGCLAQQQTQSFSSTPQRQKRNKGGPKTDPRIGKTGKRPPVLRNQADVDLVNIRYHLGHPQLPRPLRFSRYESLTTPAANSTKSTILKYPRSPPLDHPSRLANVPVEAACEPPAAASAAIQVHVQRMRSSAVD